MCISLGSVGDIRVKRVEMRHKYTQRNQLDFARVYWQSPLQAVYRFSLRVAVYRKLRMDLVWMSLSAAVAFAHG